MVPFLCKTAIDESYQPCECPQWEMESQCGGNPLLFRFQILSYSSLFNRLETTERAPQPEQAHIQAYLPTVGTSLILQESESIVIGH